MALLPLPSDASNVASGPMAHGLVRQHRSIDELMRLLPSCEHETIVQLE